MYPFTIGGIFSPMKFQDCPEILSLSGSFKEGKDEYYHRLDFCSLIMLDGFCRFESEDYVRDIIPGDILIVPAGQSRIYRHPRSLKCRHGHFTTVRPPERILFHRSGAAFRSFAAEFDRINLMERRNRGRATARFWELLHRIEDRTPGEGAERNTVHPALAEAVRHLEFNFHRPVDMEELASICGISHNQLIRLFRREMGTTIIGYLSEKRLSHAYELLTQTGLPVKEIRFKCGYRDSQYFNKAVRRRFGLSPTALRVSVL